MQWVFAIGKYFTVFTTLDSEGIFFALFPRDIKGSRIDNDDRSTLFVGISHGIPGTAGASIPY